jgi:ubiquinone/menaquinone biosynthesis C-methylase UbiE
VLLVGNGGSAKELYFLRDEPELLIVSDLAAAGVRSLRDRHDISGYEGRVTFAAVDALDLPLADASVDIVYGNAIVHHLPDRARFLSEVVRVLRPGGSAVFADSAYASLWQTAKLTLLKPLMAYSHRRFPRSPEDIRETQQGGFREADLAREIRALGCEPYARRLSLLFYLWRRATLVALPPRLRHLGDNVAIARALTSIDRRLARVPFLRAQQVHLVWGLRKL